MNDDQKFILQSLSESVKNSAIKNQQRNELNKPDVKISIYVFAFLLGLITLLCVGLDSYAFAICYPGLAMLTISKVAFNPTLSLSTRFSNVALYHPINFFILTIPIALYGAKSANYRGFGLLIISALYVYISRNVKKSSIVHSNFINNSLSVKNFINIKKRRK